MDYTYLLDYYFLQAHCIKVGYSNNSNVKVPIFVFIKIYGRYFEPEWDKQPLYIILQQQLNVFLNKRNVVT